MTSPVRIPSVAGLFYPAEPAELEQLVRGLLAHEEAPETPPKALIVPHAGYVYSGPVAATAYRRVPASVTRVVLLGPAHRYPFRGLAAHGADRFATPLGEIELDRPAIDSILTLPQVQLLDVAHVQEHSLEVHLPFLQVRLGEGFRLVPLVVGEATPEDVADVLERLWGGPETLIVISSDLSHFHGYDTARRLDQATTDAIRALRTDEIGPQEACGCRAIGGLLNVARRRGLSVELLDLRNSGDTAGHHERVVGYGAFALA